LGKLELYVFLLGEIDIVNATFKEPFECVLPKGINKGAVLDFAVSPCKSTFLQISEDKQCRVWEFKPEKKVFNCTYVMSLHENPLAIAMHPQSIQIALSFKESIKIYYLLEDELKLAFSESCRTSTAVSYSISGHLLAVGNFNLINIYNPYSFELVT